MLIRRLAREPLSYAAINRRVGEEAWELGLCRPSYSRVRELTIHARALLREFGDEPSWSDLLLDVAFRVRTAYEVADRVDRALNLPKPEISPKERKR